jgi:gluconokinase
MVVVIMGVSGSGKTTLGEALARRTGGRFHDADDFHPDLNIQKMRGGTPLTEGDREPWLHALRHEIDAWLEQPGLSILACSALSAQSRVVLGIERPEIRLVFLDAPFDTIEARMRGRDHFMPVSLLRSQFEALERPEHALILDATAGPDALVEQVIADIQRR